MNFKLWLENTEAFPPAEFVKPDGMVNLYHFTDYMGDEMVINPDSKPRSYSMREFKTATTRRSFYYLDVRSKEHMLSNVLYQTQAPASTIYNYLKDPLGIKDKAMNFDHLFDLTKEAGYQGAYYKPPQGHVVVMFIPLRAVKTTVEDVLEPKVGIPT